MGIVDYNSPEEVRRLSNQTVRHPIARLRIEWTGTHIDTSLRLESVSDEDNQQGTAENPYRNQIYDSNKVVPYKWFHLGGYSTLDSTFYAMPIDGSDSYYQVGWRGNYIGDDNGVFNDIDSENNVMSPTIELRFEDRLFNTMIIAGDNALGEYPTEFLITLTDYLGNETSILVNEVNFPNALDIPSCTWTIRTQDEFNNINRMKIAIYKWSKPNTFVKLVEAYTGIEAEYDGKDIINLSILEETESSAGTLPVGNVSYNELDLTLQNLTNQYFPFNYDSTVRGHLTRNRKIVPYLGFREGDNEYLVPKGLYWSGEWSVGEQSTGASTSGRDRMGLLQDYTYSGFHERDRNLIYCDGYNTDDNTDIAYTYWLDITAYDLITRILNYVRARYMQDLEFDIDTSLQTVIIPIAFLTSEMSYFDILKQIAQVSMAYVYMDMPTETEIEIAHERGNINLRDILRIKSVNNIFSDTDSIADYSITASDYITRTHPERWGELANSVSVKVHEYKIENGKPTEIENNLTAEYESQDSIDRHGRARFNYPDNNLIQNYGHAKEIAISICNIFGELYRVQELQTFGDSSRNILDKLEIPEYQVFDPKNGTVDVKAKGLYTIKKIQTEFDGTLRQSIECRKLCDIKPETHTLTITAWELENHTITISAWEI